MPDGRLKLRRGTIERSLIHYRRGDTAEVKRSEVTLARLEALASPELDAIEAALAAALGVATTVEKAREIRFVGNVKFHLDEVPGLGAFVEIEAIDLDGSRGEAALRAQCDEWRARLAIAEEDLVARSYSDLRRSDDVPLDPVPHFGPRSPGRVSTMAEGLVGSEILKIAADIRAAMAAGDQVCNLTVGDFDPPQFRIPGSARGRHRRGATRRARRTTRRRTACRELREAVARFYARELGLAYPASSILIAGGGAPAHLRRVPRRARSRRPRRLPGAVVEQQPLRAHDRRRGGARGRADAETAFLPTREHLAPQLPGARLLA